jgi:hypothetical protein
MQVGQASWKDDSSVLHVIRILFNRDARDFTILHEINYKIVTRLDHKTSSDMTKMRDAVIAQGHEWVEDPVDTTVQFLKVLRDYQKNWEGKPIRARCERDGTIFDAKPLVDDLVSLSIAIECPTCKRGYI